MTRDDVYGLIAERSVWVRSNSAVSFEEGHTLLYRPTDAILRGRNEQNWEAVLALQQEFISLLGVSGTPSILPSGEPLGHYVLELFRMNPLADTLIFEGYAVNSEAERLDLNEALGAAFLDKKVLLSPGMVADQWNNKIEFRRRVTCIFGEQAVPFGKSFERSLPEEVVQFCEQAFRAKVPRVIMKMNGGGGYGNLIVRPGDPLHEKIGGFLAKPFDPTSHWVSAEHWRPWQKTFCCSFFIVDGGKTAPVHMELCEQVLSPETAGFVGGCSFNELSALDREAIVQMARPVIQEMQHEGVRGFVAVDVILCTAKFQDVVILPHSGLACLMIEANVRLNGHNQERIFCNLLARREKVSHDGIVHMRVGNKPVGKNRGESMVFFADALQGLAEPLTAQPIVPGKVYFILDVNHGVPSTYDGIMFVGRTGTVERKIREAEHLLSGMGVLQN